MDSGNLDFFSLQAFLALGDDERDALTFLQGLEARALDRAEMHEQVITAFRRDEAKTLGVVEPLDCTALTIRHETLPLKLWMICGLERIALDRNIGQKIGLPRSLLGQHTLEISNLVGFLRKMM